MARRSRSPAITFPTCTQPSAAGTGATPTDRQVSARTCDACSRHLDELVDDHPIGNPGPVAAARLRLRMRREQDADLVPHGFDDG